jgi:hypothetical protein
VGLPPHLECLSPPGNLFTMDSSLPDMSSTTTNSSQHKGSIPTIFHNRMESEPVTLESHEGEPSIPHATGSRSRSPSPSARQKENGHQTAHINGSIPVDERSDPLTPTAPLPGSADVHDHPGEADVTSANLRDESVDALDIEEGKIIAGPASTNPNTSTYPSTDNISANISSLSTRPSKSNLQIMVPPKEPQPWDLVDPPETNGMTMAEKEKRLEEGAVLSGIKAKASKSSLKKMNSIRRVQKAR